MFVLGGSITQWWAVYQHVLPLDPHNSKGDLLNEIALK